MDFFKDFLKFPSFFHFFLKKGWKILQNYQILLHKLSSCQTHIAGLVLRLKSHRRGQSCAGDHHTAPYAKYQNLKGTEAWL